MAYLTIMRSLVSRWRNPIILSITIQVFLLIFPCNGQVQVYSVEDIKTDLAMIALDIVKIEVSHDDFESLNPQINDLDNYIEQIRRKISSIKSAYHSEEVERLEEELGILSNRIEDLGMARENDLVLRASGSMSGSQVLKDGELISMGANRISSLVLLTSDTLKGLIEDISFFIENDLKESARLNIASEKQKKMIPARNLGLFTVSTIFLIGTLSLIIKDLHSEGNTRRRAMEVVDFLRVKTGRDDEDENDLIVNAKNPFWDPVPKDVKEKSIERNSEVDAEYARLLKKLGYNEEAQQVLSGPIPSTTISIKEENETSTKTESSPILKENEESLSRMVIKRLYGLIIALAVRSRERRIRARRLYKKRKAAQISGAGLFPPSRPADRPNDNAPYWYGDRGHDRDI